MAFGQGRNLEARTVGGLKNGSHRWKDLPGGSSLVQVFFQRFGNDRRV